MTAFNDSLDTAGPPGSMEPRLIDDEEQVMRRALQQRLDVDHYFPVDDPTPGLVDNEDTGQHRRVTFREKADPQAVAEDTLEAYAVEAGGKSGLKVMNESGLAKILLQENDAHDALVINLDGDDLAAVLPDAVDDETIEFDAVGGHLQAKAGRYGQSAQAVGTTDVDRDSGDYADLDGMSVTLTTAGGNLVCQFAAPVRGGAVLLALLVDGAVKVETNSGPASSTSYQRPVAIHWLEANVAAGEHTVKAQWAKGGTSQIHQNGTSYKRVLTVVELPSI